MALGISKILVEVESHSIQQIIAILHRQLLDRSHKIFLAIGRRGIPVFASLLLLRLTITCYLFY